MAVEMPMVVPNRPKARPRSAPLNMFWMNPETCGAIMPPPIPWITRAMPSISGVCAAPQAALAAVNTPTPTMNTVRRLRASPRRPAGTSTMPKASA